MIRILFDEKLVLNQHHPTNKVTIFTIISHSHNRISIKLLGFKNLNNVNNKFL